jgi:hypothetical protein
MLKIKLCLICFFCFITGCAAIVGGDVAGVSLNEMDDTIPACSKSNKKYQLKIIINKDSLSEKGYLAQLTSLYTLGIIPTYQFLDADSSFRILENESVIYEKEYNNRIHIMYGFLFIPVHAFSEINKIDFNLPHAHFPLRSSIRWRTFRKALDDLPEFIKRDDLCMK